jgi:hypothetical protein
MSDTMTTNDTSRGFDTEHVVGILVILALVVLFGLRHFFASINVGVGK